ncbi:AAA family ATPase [Aliidiomarina maris]|uniref:Tn7 transposition regulator TnsC n=1 Tax=Aliidiomarina maris TaxID=531312 RepID=A0A327WVZ6_9GAMM|nr:AAA family ATPase [Aliidiomarina maris]RAJ97083.1 Tn7 transposition regulator TnsC [Aliidiomarina maris]RUO24684.1 transcriptional antiterminator [Aliidiomarina maris]
MPLPDNFVAAVYKDPGVSRYRGNPLIEALPPIMDLKALKSQLTGTVTFDPKDCFTEPHQRAHEIASLLDDFFQPLSIHRQLEEKLSVMIRAGYVGRNPKDGSLNRKMQDGYQRIMDGASNNFRFAQTNSTAKCLSLIGCSGSGKSTTVNRILSTYPPVIFHSDINFVQLPYLRIECPSDGSLKSLCLNFFREVDRTLDEDYEQKYARKRHGTEVLLSLMGQFATQKALGVLVIDEVQRLGLKRSVSKEAMLEFFVALVNVIGVPVVLVGTPKARPIFEMELQAGRRSAGFGSLFWEPMQRPNKARVDSNGKARLSEWEAFTNKLWKYQWLKHRSETLDDATRERWYSLSQGVLDIVVKLFVLAQLRAIATGIERITPELLQKVYDDELIPVHPMLDALRRNDADLIVKYSDLHLPSIDKRLLELRHLIEQQQEQKKTEVSFGNNEKALRLYNMLQAMDCDSTLLAPLIERVFKEHPTLGLPELTKIVLAWYSEPQPSKTQIRASKPKSIKSSKWHELGSDDLRFKYSQRSSSFYNDLQLGTDIFDIQSRLKQVS